MALDAATLALTAGELKQTLTDAKIAKIFEPTRDELVLTLRTRTETYALLLSARSGSARVCLTEESFENPETPPSFCMLMRKHLTGGRLLDVQMEPGDRIVYFTFQCTNEMGDLVQNILCAELMGRYSNLVLVQNGKIIDALKRAEAGLTVPELCRELGVSSATFYKWRAKFGGMDASLMARMKELEEENRRLRKMYVEEKIKAEIVSEALAKKW